MIVINTVADSRAIDNTVHREAVLQAMVFFSNQLDLEEVNVTYLENDSDVEGFLDIYKGGIQAVNMFLEEALYELITEIDDVPCAFYYEVCGAPVSLQAVAVNAFDMETFSLYMSMDERVNQDVNNED